jgi:two-component system, chemotaxis family, chemotaxis protein CheY
MDILVCDDAIFMRKYLLKILTSKGHNVVAEATNPDEAIKFFEDYSPNLVLLDIIMPKGEFADDGMEALTEILRIDPDAKVVMCSSMGQENLVIQAMDIGAQDFISKPFKPNEILEVLSKFE